MLRRRRRYFVKFENEADPVEVKATDLGQLRAWIRREHPGKSVSRITDDNGRLAGRPT